MRNQFFYFRKEALPIKKEGEDQKYQEVKDSFNVEKIIRSVSLDDGRLLVLLDDLHERPVEVEVKNKQGKVTAIKKEKQIFQSEIYLTEKNDIENFYKLTNIEL